MSAAEFAEWYEIWRMAPWELIPDAPDTEAADIDPMAFARLA